MKAAQINITCGSGSTGKICAAISELLTQRGVENYILYNNGKSQMANAFKYTDKKSVQLAALGSRVFGNWGLEGRGSTRRLVARLDEIQPDVVHLHNLHSHACDLRMLFGWLKSHGVKVFWTLHDCWAFTGYCMHYDMTGCDKWLTGCHDCPQKKSFSWFFDRSDMLYRTKKELTSGLDMTLIAPSQWMAEQAKMSFLGKYPVKVIYNGIDTEVFRPTESDFREKHGISPNEHIVLGVAYGWGKKKGLDVFADLARTLGSGYRIVLVGADERVEAQLPEGIIAVRRTQDQRELAGIYTAADVFVNPTREEVLGLTNLEALACGTPVVTFRSGGSPETVDESCGSVVDKDDIDTMRREIQRICETRPFSKKACIDRAAKFDMRLRYTDYMKLYISEE